MGCGAFFTLSYSTLVTCFYFEISDRLGLVSLRLLGHPKILGQMGTKYKTWFHFPNVPPAKLAMAMLAVSEWKCPDQLFT